MPLRVFDAGEDRERREEDRHRALQPAPDDEQPLADAQPRRHEQQADHERARDERDDEREHDPSSQTRRRQARRGSIVRPSADEHDDLGEARERRVETLDLALVRRCRASPTQDPATKTARKPEPCSDRRDAVDDARRGEGADG